MDDRRLSDFVKSGALEDLTAHLQKRRDVFEKKATTIWQSTNIGDACRVFPMLLRCISRQLLILEKSADLPIEVAAGACRVTFETNIRARLVIGDAGALMDFQIERATDELALIKSFLSLQEAGGRVETRPLHERSHQIESMLSRRGFDAAAKNSRVYSNAESVGLGREYRALYGFYSKYVHASGWLVLTTEEDRDGGAYREILQIQTQLYAEDTLARIDVEFDRLKSLQENNHH